MYIVKWRRNMNNKILEVLTENIKKEDFEAIYEILNIIKEEDSMLYIEWILHFMEENPKIDYGMPGPLVHFMEKKYKKGYEKLLLESIKRKPTEHTVWMLNRILNDVNLEDRNVYMDVLKAIVKDSKYDEELRSLAKEFLEYQEG
jgi:hypothetical protein